MRRLGPLPSRLTTRLAHVIEDLSTIGTELVLGPDGIWYANNHTDLAFLSLDETDWASLEPRSFWYRHRNRVLAHVMTRYRPTGMLYEIGAGNGSVVLNLQQLGIEVIAIEPTVRFAKAAKARGVRVVACTSIDEAGFRAGALQSVGLFDVLEHIEDQAQFLEKIGSLMPKGGRLFCAVPSYQWLWSTEDAVAGHLRRYTAASLTRVFEHAGFQVEYVTYYFAVLPVAILILRTLPTALRLRSKRSSSLSHREHDLGDGFLSRLVEFVLRVESKLLASAGRLPFGASCLAVARRQ